MIRKVAVAFLLLALFGSSARAAEIALYGSRWNHQHQEDVYGGGAGLFMSTLPVELRATYYEDTKIPGVGKLQTIPIDFGVAFHLFRAQSLGLTLGAGGSYYILDADQGSVDNDWGWYTLARLEIPLAQGMSLFGEYMHRNEDVGGIDASLDGGAINVGLILR